MWLDIIRDGVMFGMWLMKLWRMMEDIVIILVCLLFFVFYDYYGMLIMIKK